MQRGKDSGGGAWAKPSAFTGQSQPPGWALLPPGMMLRAGHRLTREMDTRNLVGPLEGAVGQLWAEHPAARGGGFCQEG